MNATKRRNGTIAERSHASQGPVLTIGTRGSRLAVWQADHVAALLSARGIQTRFEIIRTKGDLDQHTPLPRIGDKGLFTAELDAALLDGRIDLAVHSLKDLPTELPSDLVLAAVPGRGSPWDVLVARSGQVRTLDALPPASVVGSSSLRRSAQILALRPDLCIHSLRGNVETRLRKLSEGRYDAIILAEAGLQRLGLSDRISYRFSCEEIIPAVGQGALGIVCDGTREALRKNLEHELDEPAARTATAAERAFLRTLEGGCQVPVGAFASRGKGGRFRLTGVVAATDGSVLVRDAIDVEGRDPEGAGRALASKLLRSGAADILETVRSASKPGRQSHEV